MGRKAKDGFRIISKRGWLYCRFTWQGVDIRIALDTKDEHEAATSAARAYSDVVSGRVSVSPQKPGQLRDLGELWDEWVEWKRASIDPETAATLGYYGDRFVHHFRSLDRITKVGGANYAMTRLGQVLRTTVLRELCFLRQFLAWCESTGALAAAPVIPPLPPKSAGKRAGKQRAKPVLVTEREAKEIISLLPVDSKRIGARTWPIRDRFALAWETAFRPETISRLSVPENWRPGSREIVLTDEDDKSRYGRALDLTPAAMKILRSVAPTSGPIFGDHCFSKAIKRAAALVLDPTRAKQFAPYDFRHTRAKTMLDAGASLRGVAYVLGHKRPSTTDKYLAPDRKAGREAMRVAG